ncbi:DUF4145 domain-containing protein [Jeotgalicoccus sp. WY2]|uniref:DUF4145 domain-containing protein n=1 Tax=Jeotgalicoccus sp. WY2 TaxID=2708346 RepID=UPI001BD4D5AF|nr:DUF4145 domain-containing protein [Jeotgalicoccus sp. WY2]
MFICPFCNASIAETDATKRITPMGFNVDFGGYNPFEVDFIIHKVKCPSCSEKTYYLEGNQAPYSDLGNIFIYPRSRARIFPEYIPSGLREDYEEAYSILELSPKASATLSRRCLQGMIRDFHGIRGKSLYDEISQLEEIIPASQYKVLHSLRELGNIGAHFEKDVSLIVKIEVDEAEKLIKLIEFLFEKWYIERNETNELYDIINKTSNDKKILRKGESDS